MANTNILAIEMSTSSAKAMLYAGDAGVVAVKSEAYAPELCDIASHDAEGILPALKRCVAAVLAAAPGRRVDAVGLCTNWHSLMYLDADRKPLSRMYTWANSAPAETIRGLRSDVALLKSYYSRTGCMVHSAYPIWQHVHYSRKKFGPALKASYLVSQQEFLFERLTGTVAASRCTNSGSGFMNIHSLEWDAEAMAYAGVEPGMLAPLVEATHTAPLSAAAAAEFGLPPGIPVAAGGADGALNQVGDGAVRPGTMTFSVGTSGAIRLAVPEPVLPAEPSTWCYYIADGMRIVGGATSGAGNCLTWFVEKAKLGGGATHKELDAAAALVDAAKAPTFLPFLYGERCPGWNDGRLAGFVNLDSRHGTPELYYSVLEGVLFNLYHCYSILTEVMPAPREVLISGGITRSPFWLRMAADIFGVPLTVSDVEHVSLLGAVGVVEKALGLVEELGVKRFGKGQVFQPDAGKADFYRERFSAYKVAYGAEAPAEAPKGQP